MRVGVERSTWSTTAPTKLLDGLYFSCTGAFAGRTYDVSRDGQRFLHGPLRVHKSWFARAATTAERASRASVRAA